MTKKEKKAEALDRMKMLELYEPVIQDYKRTGRVYYSERTRIGEETVGILYWLNNEPEWMQKVEELEKSSKCLVYHCIHTLTEYGELLTCLCVSNDIEDWEYENWDLYYGSPSAYTFNLTVPYHSEWGAVPIISAGGGLVLGY